MSKRTLLLSGIALVAMVGILLGVLFLLPKKEEPHHEEEPDTSVSLWQKDDSVTLTKLTVELPEETYVISRNAAGNLLVDGFEDFPRADDTYAALESSLLSVTALRLINEAPADATVYGFDKDTPCLTAAHAAYSDGTVFDFEIGDLTPFGDGFYFRVAGKPAVYTVDTTFAETVGSAPGVYISTAIITAPIPENSNTDQVIVRRVTLGGTSRDGEVSFQISDDLPTSANDQTKVQSSYVLKKPYFHAVTTQSELIQYSTFTNLTTASVAKVHPTAADLKACGLSAPYSTCDFDLAVQRTTSTPGTDGGAAALSYSYYSIFNYTVELGDPDEDGNYYALFSSEGKRYDVIFTVSPDLAVWRETGYNDLADPLMFFCYITNVDRLTVTADGKATAFALAHHPDEEDTDRKLTVTAGGKTYPTADFRSLYSALMSVGRTGTIDTPPTGQPLLTVDFTVNTKTATPDTIRIYPYSAGKCQVLHRSGETYLADAKTVQALLSTYRKFLNGETLK